MVKLSAFLFVIICISLVLGACSKPTGNAQTRNNIVDSTFKEVALEVPTIFCWSCGSRVVASAKSVPGVKKVMVAGRTVIVTYNPEQTTPDAIVSAVEAGGDRVAKVTKL